MHVGIVEAGHEELFVKLHGFGMGFANAAFAHDLSDGADADNFSVAHGQRRSPGMLGIVGVNAAVEIQDGARRFLRGVRARPKHGDGSEHH